MAKIGAKADHRFGRTDTDTGTIYWDEIQKLMDMDEESNRIDRGNAFGAWEYDPETKEQMYRARSPGMQSAEARMDRRLAGEGFDPYEAPSQVSSITDALMADRMEKMGLIEPGTAELQQEEYGTRFADRSGSPTQVPPPRPQAPMPPNPQPPNPQPPNPNVPPGQPQPPGNQLPPGTNPRTGEGSIQSQGRPPMSREEQIARQMQGMA